MQNYRLSKISSLRQKDHFIWIQHPRSVSAPSSHPWHWASAKLGEVASSSIPIFEESPGWVGSAFA
jgi:hypothetical protein